MAGWGTGADPVHDREHLRHRRGAQLRLVLQSGSRRACSRKRCRNSTASKQAEIYGEIHNLIYAGSAVPVSVQQAFALRVQQEAARLPLQPARAVSLFAGHRFDLVAVAEAKPLARPSRSVRAGRAAYVLRLPLAEPHVPLLCPAILAGAAHAAVDHVRRLRADPPDAGRSAAREAAKTRARPADASSKRSSGCARSSASTSRGTWPTGTGSANVLRGDLGDSLSRPSRVVDVIGQRIGPTLLLQVTSLSLTYLLAIPIGL